jgi:hypothetical protein
MWRWCSTTSTACTDGCRELRNDHRRHDDSSYHAHLIPLPTQAGLASGFRTIRAAEAGPRLIASRYLRFSRLSK